MNCKHKEWIGKPNGCVPTHWQCVDCSTTITAGEQLVLTEIQKLKYLILHPEKKS